MRSAHHNRDAGSTERIGYAVCARDHPRHSADTNQIDGLILHELDKLRVVHGFRVAIQQDDFVRRRRSSL